MVRRRLAGRCPPVWPDLLREFIECCLHVLKAYTAVAVGGKEAAWNQTR